MRRKKKSRKGRGRGRGRESDPNKSIPTKGPVVPHQKTPLDDILLTLSLREFLLFHLLQPNIAESTLHKSVLQENTVERMNVVSRYSKLSGSLFVSLISCNMITKT